MIAFTCQQCRKRHTRPDNQAGTLVFCECGQGNRVPWAAPSPLDIPDAIPVAPRIPDAIPAASPAKSARAVPVPVPVPAELPPSRKVDDTPLETGLPSNRPARLIGKINPHFCFQHDESASETTCDACKLPFCKLCVVTLQGQTLCGPCKNFRIAALGRSPRVLPLAIVALVVSLVSGPVMLILSLVAMGLHIGEGATGAAIVLCLLATALPIAGLYLAWKALRQIDSHPEMGGRALAISGMCAALVGVLWCVTVIALLIVKYWID
jgi:hypothetical protein